MLRIFSDRIVDVRLLFPQDWIQQRIMENPLQIAIKLWRSYGSFAIGAGFSRSSSTRPLHGSPVSAKIAEDQEQVFVDRHWKQTSPACLRFFNYKWLFGEMPQQPLQFRDSPRSFVWSLHILHGVYSELMDLRRSFDVTHQVSEYQVACTVLARSS